MPARAALNAYYAWRVQGLDAKGRKEFDDVLHGWDSDNHRATQALLGGGGADD